MMKAQLAALVQQYKQFGVVKGGELLLGAGDALRYLEAVEQLGIVILIADGWAYFDAADHAKGVIQDIGVYYDVGNHLEVGANRLHDGAQKVRIFIQHLPAHIIYVSFVLDIPDEWFKDIFLASDWAE